MTSVPPRGPRQSAHRQRVRRAFAATALALLVTVGAAAPMAVRVARDEGPKPGPTTTVVDNGTPVRPTLPSGTTVPVHVLSAVAQKRHGELRVCSGAAPQPM